MDSGGEPIAHLPVRVDSVFEGFGYFYYSDVVSTDTSGAFQLLVFRKRRLQPVAEPDTVTLDIKAYATVFPGPGDPPIGRAQMRMRFSPTGEKWVVTEGEVVFGGLGN